jgi:serine/threonine protein kinase
MEDVICLSAANYDIIKELGRGDCGKVYKAHHRTTQQTVAVKITTCKNPRRFWTAEQRALALVGTTGWAPRLLDWNHRPIFYLTMEYVSGITLREYIHNSDVTPLTALTITDHILAAALAFQNVSIAHGDLKCDNILYLPRWPMIRIIDFGLAMELDPSAPEHTRRVITGGTPLNLAPEDLLQGLGVCTPVLVCASETWAIGIILVELLCQGNHPFADAHNLEDLYQLATTWVQRRLYIHVSPSVMVQQLLQGLFHLNPEKRLRYQQARFLITQALRELDTPPVCNPTMS